MNTPQFSTVHHNSKTCPFIMISNVFDASLGFLLDSNASYENLEEYTDDFILFENLSDTDLTPTSFSETSVTISSPAIL
jgi:hypothetical protein